MSKMPGLAIVGALVLVVGALFTWENRTAATEDSATRLGSLISGKIPPDARNLACGSDQVKSWSIQRRCGFDTSMPVAAYLSWLRGSTSVYRQVASDENRSMSTLYADGEQRTVDVLLTRIANGGSHVDLLFSVSAD